MEKYSFFEGKYEKVYKILFAFFVAKGLLHTGRVTVLRLFHTGRVLSKRWQAQWPYVQSDNRRMRTRNLVFQEQSSVTSMYTYILCLYCGYRVLTVEIGARCCRRVANQQAIIPLRLRELLLGLLTGSRCISIIGSSWKLLGSYCSVVAIICFYSILFKWIYLPDDISSFCNCIWKVGQCFLR